MSNPAGLKFTKTDEWVKVVGNTATIGITDYAQDQLSDVVFVEITASVGDTVRKNSTIATIESVKAAADVNTPISGTVTEVNDQLPDGPEQVNSDPFGKAWMLKLEINDLSELDTLMDSDGYEAYLKERSH